MMALITSDELAKDVAGAEALINKHKEHRAEIDTRLKDFTRFTQTGQALIMEGHFLSDKVRLKSAKQYMISTIFLVRQGEAEKCKTIYDFYNISCQTR